MAKFRFHDFLFGKVPFLLLLLLLLSHICFQVATCGSIVKFLPGFQGPLPFVLKTGYVGVGEQEDVQVFYYFIESERNPKDDPLLLWLTGGPGCSALSGLVYEIGPIMFKKEYYNGSVPNLILRPASWTKVSSVIFADLPVSTGFTYATTESGAQRSDLIQVNQAHEFLRKWLVEHPEFQSNEVYIAGDSYSGITIPPIVQEIAQGNEKGFQPKINLQGYVLGNPLTIRTEKNYQIPYAHGMGFISDELYESLQKNCNGDYTNVDPKNLLCSRDINSYDEVIKGINTAHILEPTECRWLRHENTPRRSLIKKYLSRVPPLSCPVIKGINTAHILEPTECRWLRHENTPRRSLIKKYLSRVPPLSCPNYPQLLSSYWANNSTVRKALHIREGTIGKWKRRSDKIPYTGDISNSFDYHVNLSDKGYRSLIYSGDHDISIPFLDTKAWIKSLNYSIVDDWRQWHTEGQVAGYTRTYSNGMTFATVKGGGHTAAEYRPEECLAMISRWISKRPL